MDVLDGMVVVVSPKSGLVCPSRSHSCLPTPHPREGERGSREGDGDKQPWASSIRRSNSSIGIRISVCQCQSSQPAKPASQVNSIINRSVAHANRGGCQLST